MFGISGSYSDGHDDGCGTDGSIRGSDGIPVLSVVVVEVGLIVDWSVGNNVMG